MQPRINVAIKAARAAADYIVHSQEKLLFDKEQGQQSNQVYQTVCQGAEKTIIHHLEKAYPNDTITSRLAGSVQNGEEGEWIIDTIQGQYLFTRGLSGHCITMSYLVSGKVEHAVIINPMTKDEYFASKGRGAYLNNSRIRTSSARDIDNTLIAAQFPSTDKTLPSAAGQFSTFAQLAEKGARIVSQDSPALQIANVAAGRLDAVWGIKLYEWEMQAALFISKEAGCIFSDFNGSPNTEETGNVLCANPRLFKSLLPILNKNLN